MAYDSLVHSLHKALRNCMEPSCSTPPFLTLHFTEKDLMLTLRLLWVWPILPPLGHILSVNKGIVLFAPSIVGAHVKILGQGQAINISPPLGAGLDLPPPYHSLVLVGRTGSCRPLPIPTWKLRISTIVLFWSKSGNGYNSNTAIGCCALPLQPA